MYKSLFVAARRSTVISSQLLATAQRTLSTEAVAPVANVNLFDPTRDVTFDADEAFRICKSFCTKDFDQNILVRQALLTCPLNAGHHTMVLLMFTLTLYLFHTSFLDCH
jgi:hypothetical protein